MAPSEAKRHREPMMARDVAYTGIGSSIHIRAAAMNMAMVMFCTGVNGKVCGKITGSE